MKQLLLISDPVGRSTSVQFDLLSSLNSNLRDRFRVSIYTPYIDPHHRADLESAGCSVITPPGDRFVFNQLLGFTGIDNESMLWAESWWREAFHRKNLREAARIVDPRRFDYIVNLSMTVPAPCDLWWILGTPLDQTIDGMARTNVVAAFAKAFGMRLVSYLDRSVVGRIEARTHKIVANSPYLRDLHRQHGTPVQGVVYTLTDLSDFRPIESADDSKYVLLYMGKETGEIDFDALKQAGVRVVAFGSKIPIGMRFRRIRDSVEFLGRVSREKLVHLYSNALFTLFPFSDEPMGLVPIESMACGTPVLTYNRQGPATTVVDGKTGWLVETPDQLVARATELWNKGETGISTQDCVRRAQQFTVKRSVEELMGWIEPALDSVHRSLRGADRHSFVGPVGGEAA